MGGCTDQPVNEAERSRRADEVKRQRKEPVLQPRTAAEMSSDFKAALESDNHTEALWFARELKSKYSGTPEAERAIELIPEIEAAIKAEAEAARIRAAEAAAAAEVQRLADKWTYRSSQDAMTSKTAKFASIESENTVNFGFPYKGAQRGTLTIRDHPTYGHDVILTIERGQILCYSYKECKIRVRFDEEPPLPWTAVGPKDNSRTAIFLRNESLFVQKLRTAKVVRLQVPVYKEGAPIFEFQVVGFDHARYLAGN